MYCQRKAPPLLTNWAYGDVAEEDVRFGVRNRGTESDVASETSALRGKLSQLLAFNTFFAKNQKLTSYCIHSLCGLLPRSALGLIFRLDILLPSASRAPKSVATLQRPRITFQLCLLITQSPNSGKNVSQSLCTSFAGYSSFIHSSICLTQMSPPLLFCRTRSESHSARSHSREA